MEDVITTLEKELQDTIDEYNNLQDKAIRSAKTKILGAFGVAFMQLSGMGSGIYYFSSWDVVEPLTFMFSSFWLMIGSTFHLYHKIDFEYMNAYEYFKQRELNRLISQTNFDEKKRDFLKSYIVEIK
mgnify:CR=1 FL=1